MWMVEKLLAKIDHFVEPKKKRSKKYIWIFLLHEYDIEWFIFVSYNASFFWLYAY